MASLTAHLVGRGGHGRLPFRPDCPVCRRERLAGALSSEPVISRRTRAALASGVIALTAGAPATAFAGETDRVQEGVAAPEQPGGGETAAPDFDPGGETALPFEVGSPSAGPQDGGSPESAPLEPEPTYDPDARVAPPGEPGAPAPGPEADAPVPPSQASPPEGSAEPGETAEPGEAAPSEPAAPGPPAPGPGHEGFARADEPSSDARSDDPEAPRHDSGARTQTRMGSAPPAHGAPIATPSAPAASPQVPAPTAASAPGTGSSGLTAMPADRIEVRAGRFHVVQPGESLWTIAKRLLGPDVSAARIAREVARLWALNEEQIATGDPDLLLAGTKLRLR